MRRTDQFLIKVSTQLHKHFVRGKSLFKVNNTLWFCLLFKLNGKNPNLLKLLEDVVFWLLIFEKKLNHNLYSGEILKTVKTCLKISFLINIPSIQIR